jgi:hypothetical protein
VGKLLMDFQVNKKAIFLFIIILGAILLPIILQQTWHSFSITDQIAAFSLESYDQEVYDNNACFVALMDTQKIDYVRTMFLVKLNKQIIYSEEVILPEKNNFYFCIPNNLLVDGNNFVEAELYFKTVFFNVEKISGESDKNNFSNETIVQINGFEKINDSKGVVEFTLSTNQSTQEKTDFYVNNEKVLSAFISNGTNSEIIELQGGENKIKIIHGETSDEYLFENIISWKSNILFGLIILSLLIFSLFGFAFGSNEIYERIALTLVSALSIIMVVLFLLNSINQLSEITFILFILVISIAIIYFFKEKFSVPKIKIRKPDHFETFLILLLLSTLLFNIITPTNVSFWTSFYERQSETIFENMSIPFNDEFTHFGEKPFGYMSGYFLISSGTAILFGESGELIFSIIMFISNIALVLSAIVFFKKIGMNKEQSLLTVMLMLLGGFILGDIFFNVRHVISLALSFVSMSLFIDKKLNFAVVVAGLAIFVQTPVIIFIALVTFALSKQKLMDYAKYFIGSSAIGLSFFVPVFIAHGPLTQAKAATWGYFFGMPFYGVAVDLLAQFIFFFLILIPIIKLKPSFDSVSKRVFIAVIILIFVQLFISYRVNVATIIIFSFLCVYLFPKELLKKFETKHFIFVIFIFGLFISINVLLNYVVPDYALHPVEYIKFNTSTESRFLVEPALGHYTAHFAKRKMSTDLAVEYADQELIDDSFAFLMEKDESLLSKHNIDYVFNRAKYIETQPVGSQELDKPIEFEFMDKIYDNGIFYIHQTR